MSALDRDCPKCSAAPGVPCYSARNARMKTTHKERGQTPASARFYDHYLPRRDGADREVAREDARAILDGRPGDAVEVLRALVDAIADDVPRGDHDEVLKDHAREIAELQKQVHDLEGERDLEKRNAQSARAALAEYRRLYDVAVADAARLRGLLLEAERRAGMIEDGDAIL